MNRVIVCNGGYRTGSTVIFNIIRSLVDRQDIGYTSEGTSNWLAEEYCRKENDCLKILKIHRWVPDWEGRENVQFIYTFRNLLDVAASNLTVSFGGEWSNVMAGLYMQKTQEEAMRERMDTLMISYDDIYSDLKKVVQSIARFLNFDITVEQGEKISGEWSLEEVKKQIKGLRGLEANSLTQFRANHVSSKTEGRPGGWEDILTKEQAKQVRGMMK